MQEVVCVCTTLQLSWHVMIACVVHDAYRLCVCSGSRDCCIKHPATLACAGSSSMGLGKHRTHNPCVQRW